MSEKTVAKAKQYLTEGRVKVRRASEDVASFDVQGSAKFPYTVAVTPQIGWDCTCDAHVECAHIKACKLICPLDQSPEVQLFQSSMDSLFQIKIPSHDELQD